MTHLFHAWESISGRLTGSGRLLLMLDFDGTLAPIVPHPPDARMPPESRSLLGRLRDLPLVEIAVVSGRAAADVRSLVGLDGVHYFGCHGRERIRPEGGPVEVDERGRASIRAVCARLAEALGDVAGFVVEDKGVSAAAHFRNAAAENRDRIAREVREAVEATGRLQASPGKMVYDITPLDGVDKGTAAAELVRERGGTPIYFGDDTTDESAFRALSGQAVTVFVGPPDNESAARYRVADPHEVTRALDRILTSVRR